MGAWGVGAFEDDTALDWLDEEFEAVGDEAVVAILEEVSSMEVTGYLEVDQGSAARAAAEIVAIAFGKGNAKTPEEVIAKISKYMNDIQAQPNIKALAISAVKRVNSENSEVKELWTESEATALEWEADIKDLLSRLGD